LRQQLVRIQVVNIGQVGDVTQLAGFGSFAEYSLATATVRQAIEVARRAGLIGEDILGSGFDLDVDVVRGAGAFLCGESTAMVNVLENKKCQPRKRPPHLSEVGLWGKPTCINNVETLANVPLIIGEGAAWFRSVGTEKSPGTKIFSVVGSVERCGLVEVPMGCSLGTLVVDIASAQNPKAVQIGGPSGVILPTSLSELEISFEGLDEVDGMMGSGGLVVISETQCVVDTTQYLLAFSSKQSCKRCSVCRDGSAESAELLKRITCGQGSLGDIEKLREWAELSKKRNLCGLGRTAFNPVISGLRYFMDEYLAHIEGRCPGLVCRELISYEIDETRCQGERCCLLTCPGNAIKGSFGKPGHIVSRLCQKCGMCIVSCPYKAVRVKSPAV
ncbi:MAG: NADH-quinone oxidoreductase subunit F, partial [Actinobacteria bacterium]|nr:NADH-quinone oxidoreductase subunit F [Actinomycetota bacterium]